MTGGLLGDPKCGCVEGICSIVDDCGNLAANNLIIPRDVKVVRST